VNTKKVLLGLIVVTAAIFAVIYGVMQEYLIATFSFALGLIWLISEIHNDRAANSVFFLSFLGLAIWGSLNSVPIPIVLLGLSTDLAAWDLSLFQARIADEAKSEARVLLEKKHLQKLAVTACAGFLIALPPAFIKISVDFVVIFLMIFLTVLTLKSAVSYLNNDN
jgi:dolichol kinase